MKHFAPIFRQVDAVFYVETKKEYYRSPVLGIAIDGDGNLDFIDSDCLGELDVPHTATNFIGYEFDGKQTDWTETVRKKFGNGK